MVKVCKSSGLQGTGVILAKPGYLIGVTLIAEPKWGGHLVSVVLHDDPDSADGNVLAKIMLYTSDTDEGKTKVDNPSVPIIAEKGIYATVTGTDATKCIVKYAEAPLGVHKHV